MYNDNKVIDLFRDESMGRNNFVNIGEQRFEKIRERKAFYIDKSDFIREWWDTGTTVTLITRPRRFGKTLNMSMLFIDNDGEYDTYWADTSGNGLVNSLIRQGNTTVKNNFSESQ